MPEEYTKYDLRTAYNIALGDAIDERNTDGNDKLLQLASSVHADLMRENPSYVKLFNNAAQLSETLDGVIDHVCALPSPNGGRLSQLAADFKAIKLLFPHVGDIISGKVTLLRLERMAIPLMQQRIE